MAFTGVLSTGQAGLASGTRSPVCGELHTWGFPHWGGWQGTSGKPVNTPHHAYLHAHTPHMHTVPCPVESTGFLSLHQLPCSRWNVLPVTVSSKGPLARAQMARPAPRAPVP